MVIPEKDLPHVFDRFYKGESTASTGMGLGLFLASEIVRSHKGKITIHNSNNDVELKVLLPKYYDPKV